jgi:Uri superfamily endonuclease
MFYLRSKAAEKMMRSEPGTYALILYNPKKNQVQIGQWQTIEIKRGYYIYVGSAFGPGGVKARVSRHFKPEKSKRWHIDYLRAVTRPKWAWYTHDQRRVEHEWADVLSRQPGISSIEGFGCSDCRCRSHLFYSLKKPEIQIVRKALGCKIMNYIYRKLPG